VSRPLCLLFTILLLGFSLGLSAQYEVILLDTFDDDIVGQPPGTPEVGTSTHLGPATYTITDDYGSPRLRTVDIDPSEPSSSTWYPTGPPLMTEITYTVRMETYGGPYPIAQSFAVDVDGVLERIYLIWRDDGLLQLQTTLLGTWSANHDYEQRMVIDCVHDKGIFQHDIQLVYLFDLPFDCDSFESFSSGGFFNYPSNATYAIEDVMIVDFLPIFIDGFETGDTLQWSATVPTP